MRPTKQRSTGPEEVFTQKIVALFIEKSRIFLWQDGLNQSSKDQKVTNHLDLKLDLEVPMGKDLVEEDIKEVTKAEVPLQGVNPRVASAQLHQVTVPNIIMGSTVTQLSKLPEPQCQGMCQNVCQDLNLMTKVMQKESWWGDTPLHKRLQHSLAWWSKNASPEVITLLREGIKPPWSNPPKLTLNNHQRGGQDLEQVMKILQDYQCSGAIKKLESTTSNHLIPWFLISKPEGGGCQMETHLRLQRIQPMVYTPPIQTGTHATDFAKFAKGKLGSKGGFKRCIFSCPSTYRFKKFFKTPGGRSSVGIPKWPLWTQHYARDFHENDENISKKNGGKRVSKYTYIWTTYCWWPPPPFYN